MKKRVYFVRHGESEANIGGALGEETPLTQRGIEQAKYIGQRATKLPIEIIVPSTALRAIQTAQYIADATDKRLADASDLFVEKRFATEQLGLSIHNTEVVRIDSLINQYFGTEFRFSDEENFEDLKQRAIQALQYLEQRAEQHILVVSHGMFIRIMMAILVFGNELTGHECDKIYKGFRSENTGLTIFEYNPDDRMSAWRVFVWNDHAHLG